MQEESSNGLFTTSIQITQVHPKECDLNDQVKKKKKVVIRNKHQLIRL